MVGRRLTPVSEQDRARWDERYGAEGAAPIIDPPPPPPLFAGLEHLFPTSGRALEIACGRGRGGVWLAHRGMDYRGVDVSPVAISLARELAQASGAGDRCRFEVHDLDDGLPEGPSADLLMSYLFLEPGLAGAMLARVAPGGTLAIATLSEVGADPGPYRARPGELTDLFGSLTVLAAGEGDGVAWLIGRRPA